MEKLLDGEKMAAVWREFGISGKTGYKIFNRYKNIGIEGLQDRSQPYRYANRLPFQVEKTTLDLKQDHPTWGAPKIPDKIVNAFPMISPPA